MPSRAKADSSEIHDLYEKLGSAQEVARRLGLHPNTVYQSLRAKRGVCKNCKNAAAPKRLYCEQCLERLRNKEREDRQQRSRQGICVLCDSRIESPSRLYCQPHRLAAIEAGAKYDKKQRYVHGLQLPEAARDRRLREKYTQAAVDRWHEEDGKCEMCGVAYSDRAIHIHHIDENDTNHSPQNLALLCQRCHTAVHRMLKIDDWPRAKNWLRKTYPDLLL